MIPERFKIHSFDSFKTNSNDQKGKKVFCKNYADNFSEKLKLGTSLILCGKTGTGKTHLSCAIANQIIQQSGNPVVFLSVMRAIRTVKETYSKSSKLTEQQAINNLSRPDLLILDEVGVQFGSDAEKIILFEIINERYQNMKPTILISNLSPEEITDFIGDRVADRMRENGGTVLKFEWESNRASKEVTKC
jgi:DNA replication protein DnaC